MNVSVVFTNLAFSENNSELKITRKELKELFVFSTSKTNFIFDGVIYGQIDGIAMGLPLAPTLANLFMGYNEGKWLSEFGGGGGGGGAGPKFYTCYVDDIFAVFENESEGQLFLHYLNTRHPNIKFTKEYNINGTLAFLEISISNLDGFKTSVYHKSTYTGLHTNFKCIAPHEYKKRLINTLLDRINSSWKGFDLDVKSLCQNLMRNMYPKRMIDRVVRQFLDKKLSKTVNEKIPETNQEIRYITLPYIGHYSENVKGKISDMIKNFCKEKVKIKLI